MDAGGFWKLVDHAREQALDLDERRAWLSGRLALLPAGEIADFAARLDEQRRRVDTWAHWQAATLICHGLCGMDSFFYFQAWLIGLGREVFESVVRSPDALASVPHVRRLASLGPVRGWADADWPEWESLYRVADAGVRDGVHRGAGRVAGVAGAAAGVGRVARRRRREDGGSGRHRAPDSAVVGVVRKCCLICAPIGARR